MAPRKKNQTTAEQNEQGQELTRTQEQGGDQGQTDDQERTDDLERTGDQERTDDQEPERDEFANLPNPCVYCGPSVRGVARQYTTYQGGIPGSLKEFIKEHPAARGLIVSTEKFAGIRKRLETHGTAEAIIYKKVKDEL